MAPVTVLDEENSHSDELPLRSSHKRVDPQESARRVAEPTQHFVPPQCVPLARYADYAYVSALLERNASTIEQLLSRWVGERRR